MYNLGETIYLWNKSDPNLIRAFFCDFCYEFLNNNSINSPINQLWSDFQSACHFCLDNLVPSKLSSNKKFHQPWITTSIKRPCRWKRRAYAQYRRSHTPCYAIKLSRILLKKNADKPTTTIFRDSLTPIVQETLRNYGHISKDKRWTILAYLPYVIMVKLSQNPVTKSIFSIATSAQFLLPKIYHLVTC